MRAAVDQQTISRMNQLSILKIVKTSGRITRAGISQILKLSPPSVSSNIDKLMQKNLILEYDTVLSNGGPGRKGTLIGLNDTFGFIVCVNLSGPMLWVGIGDISENIISYEAFTAIEGRSADEIIPCLMDAIETILKKNTILLSQVAAIVICSPGVIDSSTGSIECAPQFPGWDEVNIIEVLRGTYNVHIMMINDINIIALGELMYGIGTQFDSFVYISIDLGIGGGVIIDRNLISGYRYAAGELGYMLTSIEQLSYKPKQGHLESLICVPTIRANIAKKLGCPENDMTIAKINQLYRDGNYVVQQEIEYLAKLLSMCIVNITAVLNTPVVCLGGMICEFDVNLDQLISEYIQNMVPYPPKIVISSLGAQGFMRGALHMGSETIIDLSINSDS